MSKHIEDVRTPRRKRVAVPPAASDPRRCATFLFSIDLEDIRLMPGGSRFSEYVPANTERYLKFLAERGLRCTFFTVGNVARRYPSLIRQIAAERHEVACHSNDHLPLDRHDEWSFREDLLRCLDALSQAGVDRVVGFRAPMASMTRFMTKVEFMRNTTIDNTVNIRIRDPPEFTVL